MPKTIFLLFAFVSAINVVFSQTADEYFRAGEIYYDEGRFHEARLIFEEA